ncbi:Hypothetical predicted protein [Olea europaea subsp. europaea]|uniref:Uncharacterized protein n=1 Tax=Olea europaea subsp. europaea TaxID=158383 RepID=A0A8S0QY73_OLEEU|nr:Hypothetical predicted protein [Olea europaea subsp. europaea]
MCAGTKDCNGRRVQDEGDLRTSKWEQGSGYGLGDEGMRLENEAKHLKVNVKTEEGRKSQTEFVKKPPKLRLTRENPNRRSGGGDDDENEGIDETMNFINSRFNGGGIAMKFSNGGNVSDIDITLNVDDGGNINRYENWQQNTSSGDDGETRWRNVCYLNGDSDKKDITYNDFDYSLGEEDDVLFEENVTQNIELDMRNEIVSLEAVDESDNSEYAPSNNFQSIYSDSDEVFTYTEFNGEVDMVDHVLELGLKIRYQKEASYTTNEGLTGSTSFIPKPRTNFSKNGSIPQRRPRASGSLNSTATLSEAWNNLMTK